MKETLPAISDAGIKPLVAQVPTPPSEQDGIIEGKPTLSERVAVTTKPLLKLKKPRVDLSKAVLPGQIKMRI